MAKPKPEIVDWLEEVFAPLGAIDAVRLFGGWQLKADGRAVRGVLDGTLYFLADAALRAELAAAGARPFRYAKAGGMVTIGRFVSAPEADMDDEAALVGLGAAGPAPGNLNPYVQRPRLEAARPLPGRGSTMGHRLTIPLNFVAIGGDGAEIGEERVHDIAERDLCERCTDGPKCWVLQTMVIMAQRGLAVSIGRRAVPGAVNVVHPFDFGLRHRGLRPYILSCRADAHRPLTANFWLEQSGARGRSHRHAWVPHWPQPGIVPRDPARGAAVETLVFKGDEINLDARFRSEAFVRALGGLGVALRLDTLRSASDAGTSGLVANWHDYGSADLVLAARNLTRADAEGKPGSKLVNAWIAGAPALLGPEPGFREIRQSELDYIEVRTPEDVLDAVRRLKAAPELYRRMVENGRDRARAFDTDATLARWLDILNGPVRDDFLRWEATSAVERSIRLAPRFLAERASRRAHLRAIQDGPRILD